METGKKSTGRICILTSNQIKRHPKTFYHFIFRLKKEKRSFIVKRCVEERRKLDESHKMRVEMEGKKIEEVRKSLPAEVDR